LKWYYQQWQGSINVHIDFFPIYPFKKFLDHTIFWLIVNTEVLSIPEIIFDITFLEPFHFCLSTSMKNQHGLVLRYTTKWKLSSEETNYTKATATVFNELSNNYNEL